jgi:hypothetical protein
MSNEGRFSATDMAILCLFPFLIILYFLAAGLMHGRWANLATIVGLAAVASFLALPIWVVLHVFRAIGSRPKSLLWVESVLGGLWLSIGILWWTYDVLPRIVAVCVSGLVGVATALSPYIATRFARARKRVPSLS